MTPPIEKILLAAAARLYPDCRRESDRARAALTMAVGMLEGLLDEDETLREISFRMYNARLALDARDLGLVEPQRGGVN